VTPENDGHSEDSSQRGSAAGPVDESLRELGKGGQPNST
jgi:hypothetical protein